MVPGNIVFNFILGPEQSQNITVTYDSFESLFADVAKGKSIPQCILGYCLINGLGTEKNEQKGIACLMQSANQGFTPAQEQLHTFFLSRDGGLWNVPTLNSYNVKRLQDLEAIHKYFEDTPESNGVPKAKLPLVIMGQPGIGKTHLALQYIYSIFTPQTRVVFFTKDNLEEQYLNFAIAIKYCDDKVTTIQNANRTIKTRILNSKNYQWIFVFDDPPSYDSSIKLLLYDFPNLKTIITTTNTNWSDSFPAVKVKEMLSVESVAIVNKYIEGADQSLAIQLADTMGHIPSAIVQATFFINDNKLSLSKYLEEFKKNPTIFFSDKSFSQSTSQISISDRWRNIIHEIRHNNPEAYDMLMACAYFPPKKIPKKLMARWFENKYSSYRIPTLQSDLVFGEILEKLVMRYSFSSGEEYFIINPLFCKFLQHEHLNSNNLDTGDTKTKMEISTVCQFSPEWFLPLFSTIQNEITRTTGKDGKYESEVKSYHDILVGHINEIVKIRAEIFKDSMKEHINISGILAIILEFYEPFSREFTEKSHEQIGDTFLKQFGLKQMSNKSVNDALNPNSRLSLGEV